MMIGSPVRGLPAEQWRKREQPHAQTRDQCGSGACTLPHTIAGTDIPPCSTKRAFFDLLSGEEQPTPRHFVSAVNFLHTCPITIARLELKNRTFLSIHRITESTRCVQSGAQLCIGVCARAPAYASPSCAQIRVYAMLAELIACIVHLQQIRFPAIARCRTMRRKGHAVPSRA